jgi:cobalt-zinc-cadmium efflux system protein
MTHGHAGPTNTRALKISAVLIALYFVFELAVALATGSLSLLADAAHELSTFIAIGISLVAMRLAHRPPTATRTFGFLRAEVLAALLNGLLLLVMAGFIVVRAVDRINEPMAVPSVPMLVMAVGGIGLEVASLRIMWKGQKQDLNVRGSFWHVVNAFLGSVAVIIAALFIQFGQIYVADAWAGLLFAFILVYAAYGIIRDATRMLVDTVPTDVDMEALGRELKALPGVVDAHHLHARAITSDLRVFSGHLVVPEPRDARMVLAAAKRIVEGEHGFAQSTIQVEEPGLVEADERRLEARV